MQTLVIYMYLKASIQTLVIYMYLKKNNTPFKSTTYNSNHANVNYLCVFKSITKKLHFYNFTKKIIDITIIMLLFSALL